MNPAVSHTSISHGIQTNRQTDSKTEWDTERKVGERNDKGNQRRENKANSRGSEKVRKPGCERNSELWIISEKRFGPHFASSIVSSTPGAVSFCFPSCCHSNGWQFHIGATCPADRQLATTRGTRLHTRTGTHAHTYTIASLPCWPAVRYKKPWGSCLHTPKLHHHVPLEHLQLSFSTPYCTSYIYIAFAYRIKVKQKALQTRNRTQNTMWLDSTFYMYSYA